MTKTPQEMAEAWVARIMFELDFDGHGPISIKDQVREALSDVYLAGKK